MPLHKFRMENVGRFDITREFKADYDDEDKILDEIGNHLASSNIFVVWDDDGVTGTIMAGMRNVGTLIDLGPVVDGVPEPDLP